MVDEGNRLYTAAQGHLPSRAAPVAFNGTVILSPSCGLSVWMCVVSDSGALFIKEAEQCVL